MPGWPGTLQLCSECGGCPRCGGSWELSGPGRCGGNNSRSNAVGIANWSVVSWSS
jgi:hypothetical protein